MSLRTILFLLAFLLAGSFAFTDDPASDSIIIVMPKGDQELGRKAFLKFECNVCHLVKNDRTLPEPTSKDRGPDLGELRWSAGYQVNSIIAPSHLIVYEYLMKSDTGKSPMPDLTSRMSVKELIDLLAYLRFSQNSPK